MSNQNLLTRITNELTTIQALSGKELANYLQNLANTIEPLIQNLLNELGRIMEEKYGEPVNYIDNASPKIALAYLFLCARFIRPSEIESENRTRLASMMELLINSEQIIIPNDSTKSRKINAIAGMCVVFYLLNSRIYHDKEEIFYVNTQNIAVDIRMKEILNNHLLWIESRGIHSTNNLGYMPVFINAQFHELVDLVVGASFEIN